MRTGIRLFTLKITLHIFYLIFFFFVFNTNGNVIVIPPGWMDGCMNEWEEMFISLKCYRQIKAGGHLHQRYSENESAGRPLRLMVRINWIWCNCYCHVYPNGRNVIHSSALSPNGILYPFDELLKWPQNRQWWPFIIFVWIYRQKCKIFT